MSIIDSETTILIKVEPADTDFDSDYFDVTGFEESAKSMNLEEEFMSKRIKVEEEAVQKFFFCFYCQGAWKSLLCLKKHIKNNHSSLYRNGSFNNRDTNLFELRDYKATGEHNIMENLTSSSGYCELKQNPSRTSNPFFEQNKEMEYLCPLCEYKTKRSTVLENHLFAKHPDAEPYSCDQCDYKTAINTHLKSHILRNHSIEKSHFCPMCEYETKESTELRSHIMASHNHGKKTYYCPQCDYRTTRWEYLKYHIDTKHPLEKFNFVPQDYEYSARLVRNFRKFFKADHSVDRLNSCLECGYKAASSRSLKKHFIEQHTIENLHSCPQCEYKTGAAKDLKSHIATEHRGQKVKYYFCTLCEFKTIKKGAFENHLFMTHPDAEPYSCPHCNYKTAMSIRLKSHILVNHSTETSYSCTKCGFKTKESTDFKNHFVTVHASKKTLLSTVPV